MSGTGSRPCRGKGIWRTERRHLYKGAVLSIAYNKPIPAVDGNVMRVMSRILSIWDDIAKPKTRTIFEQAVSAFISHENHLNSIRV